MNKTTSLIAALSLLTGVSATFADDAKDELVKAAKALAEKPNYSWTATVVVPEDAQFKPGPTDGKAEKDGYIVVSQNFGQATLQTVKKGEKAAMTNQDGGWDSLADMEKEEGFGRFRAMMARNLVAPADDVIDLVKYLKEVKKDGDVYSGELTDEGAKGTIGFGRRGAASNPDGPKVLSAKGSAKFWVKDGVLTKTEIKMDGSMDFGGNEVNIVRTTTTEIKDVGSTKIEVPEGAKAKLD